MKFTGKVFLSTRLLSLPIWLWYFKVAARKASIILKTRLTPHSLSNFVPPNTKSWIRPWGGPSNETLKTEVKCHSRYGTKTIHLSSKDVSVGQRPKVGSPSWAMVTSLYKWNDLEQNNKCMQSIIFTRKSKEKSSDVSMKAFKMFIFAFI